MLYRRVERPLKCLYHKYVVGIARWLCGQVTRVPRQYLSRRTGFHWRTLEHKMHFAFRIEFFTRHKNRFT